MEPTWLKPDECSPPHRVTHPEKAQELEDEFRRAGWGAGFPSLVGYEAADKRGVQLLSGSHRWHAAKNAGIAIPVIVRPRRDVYRAWGDPVAWAKLLTAE